MTRFVPALIAALAAPLAAAAQPPAPATTPAPATPRPAPRWQVDWGQSYCSLVRLPDAGRPYAAAFLTVPGGAATSLMLIPQGQASLPTRVNALVLQPSGQRFEVFGYVERFGDQRVVSLGRLPYDFRDLLAGTTEVQVFAGAALRLRIPTDLVRTAIAEHRRCTAGISREWQVDEAGLAALRARPTSTNLLGYRPSDYPAAALRTATQGRVIMRITVTAEGRPADCAVLATSGNAEIDRVSCRVAMRDGRYSAGVDAAGRPVTIASVFTVVWRVPRRR